MINQWQAAQFLAKLGPEHPDGYFTDEQIATFLEEHDEVRGGRQGRPQRVSQVAR